MGVPLTEYMSLIGSYTFNLDDVTLDKSLYYSDRLGGGLQCDPLLASRYLCDAIGKRTSSIVGFSLVSNSLDNRVRPTRGQTWTLGLDVAGLGGSVKYAKLRANYAKYWPLGGGWIFSVNAEGGFIKGFTDRGPGKDSVRLTDRFFLGQPNMRGFDIRGVGPRIIRDYYAFGTDSSGVSGPACADGTIAADCSTHGGYTFVQNTSKNVYQDPLGGDAYYLGKVELEIPLGSGARELGLRPSIFMDVGSVFHVTQPDLIDTGPTYFIPTRDASGNALYSQVNVATLVTPSGGGNPVCTPGTNTGDVTTVTNPLNPNPPACLASANNTALGTNQAGFREVFYGDTPKPRLSIGIGVNWKSPFGPFRIDFAKVLLKQPGDDTKAFSFNVGTQF
jgi:outer membrane protein insertion porin family